jgi:exodeoxyribonuclease V gamma subunit
MALKFVVSNRLEVLASELVKMLKERPAGISPLVREVIAVVNPGNAKWLTHELARQMGVCLNVDFVTRGGFWNRVIPGMKKSSETYNPRTMAWHIMKILSEEAPADKALSTYLRDADKGASKYHFNLAEEIAGVFDVYQVYRADVLNSWSNGRTAGGGVETLPHVSWQKDIWMKLRAALGVKSPAELYHEFLKGKSDVECEEIIKKEFPAGRVFVFGIGTLPPIHIELYKKLANFIDVHFLYLNPCSDFWGDVTSERTALWQRKRGDKGAIASGNQMLATLANAGKALFNALLDVEEEYGAAEEMWQGADSATVLAELQNSVLENRAPELVGREMDNSLVIHICHNEMREMEVLRDDILRLMSAESDSGVTLHDIVVMAPDISKYAPAINAVFGQWNKDRPVEQRLLYSITDRTHAEESQLANAFKLLLSQGRSRMRFSEFRELLSYRAVSGILAFEEVQLSAAQNMLYDAGIRWGWDEQQREDFSGVKFSEYSWVQGLQKLAEEYILRNGIGDELGRALGAVADLAQRVNELRKKLSGNHPPAVWRTVLSGIIDDFLFVDKDSKSDEYVLRKGIAEFESTCSWAKIEDLKLPCDVIEAYMETALWSVADTAGFLSRGITFCRLQPLRNIPAKYIWIAGMNDEEYPRRDKLRSFDLLKLKPQSGDRSNRNDDCQLLLEAMLSARKYLRFSYIGNDAHDGLEKPPGVLLNAIRSQIAEAFEEPEKKDVFFELRHKLHHFSPQYFDESSNSIWLEEKRKGLWKNLSEPDFDSAKAVSQRRTLMEAVEEKGVGLIAGLMGEQKGEFFEQLKDCEFLKQKEISVEELLQFWGSPAETWLKKTLRVYHRSKGAEFESDEPVKLNGLDKWHIRNKLLEMFLEEGRFNDSAENWVERSEVMDEIIDFAQKNNLIPVGVRGEQIIYNGIMEGKNVELLKAIQRELDGWERLDKSGKVSLRFGECTLDGEISDLYKKNGSVMMFRATASDIKLKEWMRLVVLNSLIPLCNLPSEGLTHRHSIVVGRESALKIDAYDVEGAEYYAKKYFNAMISAFTNDPLPLFLLGKEGAVLCASKLAEKFDNLEGAKGSFRAKWSKYGDYSTDGDLLYNKLMFGNEFTVEVEEEMFKACTEYMLPPNIKVLGLGDVGGKK